MSEIVLVLENIRSTHNVGSILRTADCFGVKKVYFCGYTPYPKLKNDPRLPHLGDKIAKDIHKTALGAENYLDFYVFKSTHETIKHLKETGYTVAALEQSSKSTPLNKFKNPGKIALILGNEVSGIPPETLKNCDKILEIPMLGKKESLNVSISAAIALYVLSDIINNS